MDDSNDEFVGEDGQRYTILTRDNFRLLLREKMEDMMNRMGAEFENSMRELEARLDETNEKTNTLSATTDLIIERQERFFREQGLVSKVNVGVQVDLLHEEGFRGPPAVVSMSRISVPQQQDLARSSPEAGPSQVLSDLEFDASHGTERASTAVESDSTSSSWSRPQLVRVSRLPEVPNTENQAAPSGTTYSMASAASQSLGRNTAVFVAPARDLRYPPPLPVQPRPPLRSPYHPEVSPPKPVLKIERCNEGIILAWNLTLTENHAPMRSYQLYVCHMSNNISIPAWRKLSEFKALALPMACTLTHFAGGGCYHFAVRATSIYQCVGIFSDIASINMKSLSYNIGL